MSDDPSQIGDELYAWQIRDGEDSWTTIAAQIPGTAQWAPLINRTAELMDQLEWLAELHAAAWAKEKGMQAAEIRLTRFSLVEMTKRKVIPVPTEQEKQ